MRYQCFFDTLRTDVQAVGADSSFTLGLQAKASNLAGGSLALISVSVSVVESTLIAIVVPPTAVPTGHPMIKVIRVLIPVMIRVQILLLIPVMIPVLIDSKPKGGTCRIRLTPFQSNN